MLRAVYRETRRHEQQIAAQQVTQEAREQFQNNQKALKLTTTTLVALILCYLPVIVSRIILVRYRGEISVQTLCILFFLPASMGLSNSLLNPIIYTVRIRQIRVAFIELTCKTVSIAEAEEIEMRVFGAPNAVIRRETGEQHEGQNQQNVQEQANVNNCDNHNIDVLPQFENSAV